MSLWLKRFWQFVSDVGGLMHPTPLPARLSIHLAQRFPKTERPIPNGQGWPLREPATFEIAEQFFPRLLALAVAIPKAYEFFLAAGVSANDDAPSETVTLQCGAVQISYTQTDPTGKLVGNPLTATWSQVRNTSAFEV